VPVTLPDSRQVERVIRLSYAQMMLNAVFAASTGGMFLISFAIQLGADNVLLGLMITLPQFFVVFQFLAAWLNLAPMNAPFNPTGRFQNPDVK
jgi:hypothetical protein